MSFLEPCNKGAIDWRGLPVGPQLIARLIGSDGRSSTTRRRWRCVFCLRGSSRHAAVWHTDNDLPDGLRAPSPPHSVSPGVTPLSHVNHSLSVAQTTHTHRTTQSNICSVLTLSAPVSDAGINTHENLLVPEVKVQMLTMSLFSQVVTI